MKRTLVIIAGIVLIAVGLLNRYRLPGMRCVASGQCVAGDCEIRPAARDVIDVAEGTFTAGFLRTLRFDRKGRVFGKCSRIPTGCTDFYRIGLGDGVSEVSEAPLFSPSCLDRLL